MVCLSSSLQTETDFAKLIPQQTLGWSAILSWRHWLHLCLQCFCPNSTKQDLRIPLCLPQVRNAFIFHCCLASRSRLHQILLSPFLLSSVPQEIAILVFATFCTAGSNAVQLGAKSPEGRSPAARRPSSRAHPQLPHSLHQLSREHWSSSSLFSSRPVSTSQCVWNTSWGPEQRPWLTAPRQRWTVFSYTEVHLCDFILLDLEAANLTPGLYCFSTS